MKTLITGLAFAALAMQATGAPAHGFGGNTDRAGCSASHGWWGHDANFAVGREERLPSAAINYVDPGQNGSIRVHGWSNGDVLVKACIQTSAASEGEAKDLADQVKITKGAGHVQASGPANRNGRNWSVSYEIWMPMTAAAKLDAFNGSISVEGVHGRLRFHTLNGSVRLSDVSGDVDGETTNGSVAVSVSNGSPGGGGLRVETTNGSVRLELPKDFSAKVEASTVNGSIRTDFPITVSGEIGKHLSFTVGSGGREIEAKTTNGSIPITRRA